MNEPRDPQLSGVYRDAPAPEPAQRIDAAILAASRRAVGAGPRAARIGFARRWGTPVALAATVVVTFTLTLVVFEQQSGLDVVPPVAQTAAPRPDELAKISPAASRAPAPAPVAATPPAEARRDRAEQRPSETPASGEPLGAGRRALVADAPRAPEAALKAEKNVLPASAPAAGALRESTPAPQRAAALSATSARSAAPDAKERTPEKWLEDIRRLKAEGKAAESARELAEFRKRHPDYRLPEDLR